MECCDHTACPGSFRDLGFFAKTVTAESYVLQRKAVVNTFIASCVVVRGISNTAAYVNFALGDTSPLGFTGFVTSDGQDANNDLVLITNTVFSKAVLFSFLESKASSIRAITAWCSRSVAACMLEKKYFGSWIANSSLESKWCTWVSEIKRGGEGKGWAEGLAVV